MQPTVEDAGTEGSTAGDRAPWRAGFATLEPEVADEPLEIEGLIPDWLSGTLVRNGPAKFEAGDRELAHWFDGYAMLHAFAIEDGDVTYANRFLDTEAYRAAEEGKMGFGEFGTDPCRSIFGRFFHLFDPSLTDNACVHVGRLADEFVAMTETPIPIRFDPDTLETRGHLAWEQQVDGQLTTAHPLHDDRRGETVNYVTEIGRHSTYSVFAVPEGTTRQEPVASLEVDRPA